MRCPLERSRRDPVFLSHPTPTLLLNREFTIEAVSRSYVTSTGRGEDELVSANVFEAFPQNPAAPDVDSTKDFTDSFERVLRTRQPHQLGPLRYDVEDPSKPGQFVEKSWAVVNTPIRNGDDVVGVMVGVDDITSVNVDVVKALASYRETPGGEQPRDASCPQYAGAADALLAVVEGYKSLADEVTNLRRALRSRPTIEQAKGIIMAERKCCPEHAFELLKKLSMDTNVRLADVAAAIVYQLQVPEGP